MRPHPTAIKLLRMTLQAYEAKEVRWTRGIGKRRKGVPHRCLSQAIDSAAFRLSYADQRHMFGAKALLRAAIRKLTDGKYGDTSGLHLYGIVPFNDRVLKTQKDAEGVLRYTIILAERGEL